LSGKTTSSQLPDPKKVKPFTNQREEKASEQKAEKMKLNLKRQFEPITDETGWQRTLPLEKPSYACNRPPGSTAHRRSRTAAAPVKAVTINANRPDTLNEFDYEHLDYADVNAKIPKINYTMVKSEFNNEFEKIRTKKQKENAIRFEKEKNREIMETVLNNLGKKDSLKALLELYETTLHAADHINDDP
jgi:hypothetical protein